MLDPKSSLHQRRNSIDLGTYATQLPTEIVRLIAVSTISVDQLTL
jgi:hypothetical protein